MALVITGGVGIDGPPRSRRELLREYEQQPARHPALADSESAYLRKVRWLGQPRVTMKEGLS